MQRPHRVVILVLDGALPLDVGIPAGERRRTGMRRRSSRSVDLGTGSNLRLHFRRLLDVSPSEYRATFAGRS